MVVTLASESVVSPGRSSGQRGSDYEEAWFDPEVVRALVIRLPLDEPPADHYRPSRKVCDLQAGSGSIGSRVGGRRQIFVGYPDGV